MRNPIVSIAILSSLFFSVTLHAGQWVNVVASTTGHNTCDEAKVALRDIIQNGSDVYTADQYLTNQYPTMASATKGCQNRGFVAPHLVAPEIQDAQMFGLPTQKYDATVSATCSWVIDEGGNRKYGVGWTGSGACYEIAP